MNKKMTINGKEVQLTDNGKTRGGRNKWTAQIYVADIGTVFITAYSTTVVEPATISNGGPSVEAMMFEVLKGMQHSFATLEKKVAGLEKSVKEEAISAAQHQ